MSKISIQVIQAGPAIDPATPRATTLVDVVDSAGAEQKFSLDGTESPVGFIPSIDVAAGAGTATISDVAADGTVIGSPVVVPYTTAPAAQLASSGATILTVAP